MKAKDLFYQHKKKIFYTIGILFLINLSLMVFDRGILVKEECSERPLKRNAKWVEVNCSDYITGKVIIDPWAERRTDCLYWFGRGFFTTWKSRIDYCKFTEELQ